MSGWRLPRMVNPLGRHWGQRKNLHERVELFETHATIDEWDWRKLPSYESSVPSGVYAGKAWRRGSYLCWYGPERNGACRIGHLRALVTGPGTNITYREATS